MLNYLKYICPCCKCHKLTIAETLEYCCYKQCNVVAYFIVNLCMERQIDINTINKRALQLIRELSN